jgi:hypothetical protein
VTALVPVRVAFAVDTALGSGAWWFDLVVDLYFISDLVLNFRTAVWMPNGYEKRISCAPFYTKLVILPRQARDKHTQDSKRDVAFFAGSWRWTRRRSAGCTYEAGSS